MGLIQRLYIASSYAGTGSFFTWMAWLHVLPKAAGELVVVLLWLGFLLAISFTALWAKNSSPFLPHHLALDVDRTLLGTLLAVEFGLCISLWQLLVFVSAPASYAPYFPVTRLVLLTGTIILQAAWLLRKLDRRAEHAAYEELKEHPDEERGLLAHELAHHAHREGPSWIFVALYTGADALKALLLSTLVLHYLFILPV